MRAPIAITLPTNATTRYSITNLVSPSTQRLRVSPARRARQYAATPTALVPATTTAGPSRPGDQRQRRKDAVAKRIEHVVGLCGRRIQSPSASRGGAVVNSRRDMRPPRRHRDAGHARLFSLGQLHLRQADATPARRRTGRTDADRSLSVPTCTQHCCSRSSIIVFMSMNGLIVIRLMRSLHSRRNVAFLPSSASPARRRNEPRPRSHASQMLRNMSSDRRMRERRLLAHQSEQRRLYEIANLRRTRLPSRCDCSPGRGAPSPAPVQSTRSSDFHSPASVLRK